MNRSDFSHGRFNSASASEAQELREKLEDAEAANRELATLIERIKTAPKVQAFVLDVADSFVTIATGAGIVDVAVGDPVQAALLEPGTMVRVARDTLAIVDVLPTSERAVGDIGTVVACESDRECEVRVDGRNRMVRLGLKGRPEPGDRVLVNTSGAIAFRNLGAPAKAFSFDGESAITWDDIGGLEEAKEALRETFELPYRHAALFAAYGKRPLKGVMLYGPAGCGKTLLAKACATSVRGTHGRAPDDFIYVKGPEVLDRYVGESEAKIRGLFARARAHHSKYGYPAVIFIDEADALLGKRGSRMNVGMETTIVPQFLSEMDGLEDAGAVVLLATNRPDTLDPAVTRDGRIDRKVRVSRPDQRGAESVLRLHLRSRPIADDGDAAALATKAAAFLFDDSHHLYEIHLKHGGRKSFLLAHLVNGAMLAGMVEHASTAALRRDIATGIAKGITEGDFRTAALELLKQNADTNHETEVGEFCEAFTHDVVSIVPARRRTLIA